MRTCPIGIEIILHFYYSPNPSSYEGTKVYEDIVKTFNENGLIKWDGLSWNTTEKGKTWVELICSTPYPKTINKWIDPRTKEEIQ